MIFEDGQDDILIELVKICIYFQHGFDLVWPLYYLKTKKGILTGKTMVFVMLGPNGYQEIHFPLSSQKDKIDHIMTKLRPALPNLSTDWHCFDKNSILELLQDSGMLTRLNT